MATYDVLPHESMDFILCYVCEGFGLDPFREVVSQDQDEAFLPRIRHWSDYVHTPSHERIRSRHSLQAFGQAMDSRGVWLALVASLGKLFAVRVHRRPVETEAFDF